MVLLFRVFLLGAALSLSGHSQAGEDSKILVRIDQAVPRAGARVGVGSPVTLKFPADERAHGGFFLGQMVRLGGDRDQAILLDRERSRIFFVDRDKVDLPKLSYQKILRPYPQVDGTCTGYALHHMMAQTAIGGHVGNPRLNETFSTEQGRTQFLVRAINDYYLATQHRASILGILKGYGVEFGLKCEKRVFEDTQDALRYVEEKTSRGLPVMISFFVGPNMVHAPFTLQDLSGPRRLLDSRLWVPRQIGERQSGGHSVVAVATFEWQGRTEFLMLDSDWAQPRVWDASAYLGGRVKFEELEFYSCEGTK